MKGSVALVGAGPGDPGLMTVRGLATLRRAEVVVYDRLIDPRLLDEAPARALRVFVGKASGAHTLPQDEINALLVAHARRGRRVVRLKGGDPYVFGRGRRRSRGAGGRRDSVRGGARRQLGGGGAGGRRDPADPPSRRVVVRRGHRPRGRAEGVHSRGLGPPGHRRRYAGDPDGPGKSAAYRPGAAPGPGARPTRRSPSSSGARPPRSGW